jgi:serine/threonine-protein kinase
LSSPDRVLGHYEVGAEIGAGGMGRVCRGTDLRDGTPVAIKFLNALLVDASLRERFEREAHVAAPLRSPYTVHLLDYGMRRFPGP